MSKDWLQLAVDVSREAGQLLRDRADALKAVRFQDATDVKLEADVESERLIRERLAQTGLPIIGEEEGGDASLPETTQTYWVVDPLDGTYNYLRDQPACCVSIGLMRGLEPIAGAIYDFNANRLYAGSAETGLTVDGERAEADWAQSEADAVLMTGFPAGRDYSTEALMPFLRQVQRFKKIRMIGSAALALAYVATGRGDLYGEEGVRLWDVAGGLALAAASGAAVQIAPCPGKPFGFNLWVAGRAEWLPSA